MTLDVIGAGFGRTGTMSLKLALEQLGFGPCHHMMEVIAHPEQDRAWLALAQGATTDWRAILNGYRAAVDWPSVFIWKELVAANPQAKVILTLRDPQSWYASASATIFARMREFQAILAGPEVDAIDPIRREHMRMVNAVVVDKTFGGSLDKDHAIRVFDAHNAEVRRTVPPKRLLVYDVGDGWESLCAFLGVPVPQAPYPNVNTTQDFAARFPNLR